MENVSHAPTNSAFVLEHVPQLKNHLMSGPIVHFSDPPAPQIDLSAEEAPSKKAMVYPVNRKIGDCLIACKFTAIGSLVRRLSV